LTEKRVAAPLRRNFHDVKATALSGSLAVSLPNTPPAWSVEEQDACFVVRDQGLCAQAKNAGFQRFK